ncbi:MAG TPA: hypothetical protein VLG25_02535 [Patescibacteria group bacterium]|nr:hypothetical protein [Patescibacteria group bacterium]
MAQKTKKLSLSDKKRHGHHHQQSNRYIKVYWPYLPLLVLGMGLAWRGQHNSTTTYSMLLAGSVLAARHPHRKRRYHKGDESLLSHPLIDILLITALAAVVILT